MFVSEDQGLAVLCRVVGSDAPLALIYRVHYLTASRPEPVARAGAGLTDTQPPQASQQLSPTASAS